MGGIGRPPKPQTSDESKRQGFLLIGKFYSFSQSNREKKYGLYRYQQNIDEELEMRLLQLVNTNMYGGHRRVLLAELPDDLRVGLERSGFTDPIEYGIESGGKCLEDGIEQRFDEIVAQRNASLFENVASEVSSSSVSAISI